MCIFASSLCHSRGAVVHCRSFDTEDGKWQTISLPFSEFIPVFRAKTLTDGSFLNPRSVYSIQLM
jgi:Complex I intermediate-associated protein 30 (CIA30)